MSALPSVTHPEGLTTKAKLYATYVAEGRDPQVAARLAGYSHKAGHTKDLVKDPRFLTYVDKLRKRNERVIDMNRKRVMEGFLEAIEQAKLMAEPMTQIAGWREIAKMCGYYAPEVKILNINATSQRYLTQLETMSDADLLKLVEQDAELIEGEAQKVLDGSESPSLDEYQSAEQMAEQSEKSSSTDQPAA